MADAVELLLEENPTWRFMLQDPELSQLLQEAADPNSIWSPQKFQGKLYQTNWFQSRSQAKREWDILWETDKGEATRRIHEHQNEIRNRAAELGIYLDSNQIHFISTFNLNSGIDVGSPEFNFALANFAWGQTPGSFMPGAIRGEVNRADSLARREYFIAPDQSWSHATGVSLAMGYQTEQGVRENLANWAISKYPHLAGQLLAGQTMHDMFSGHINTIAEELELDPESIDMVSDKWNQIINTGWDGQTGSVRPLTVGETRVLARKDDRFWNTTNGRAMDAGLTNQILETFGARA